MRILVVNWRDVKNPLAGGAEVHLWENLIRLKKKGHSITFISTGFSGAKKEEIIDGINVMRTGSEWNFNYTGSYMLRKMANSGDYDVVIEDINKIPFYSPLYVNIPVLGIVPHIFGKTIFYQTNPVFASYVYMWEFPLPKVYRNVKFLVISPSTKEDMVRRGFPEDNIEVVYCGIDSSYSYDKDIKKYKVPTITYIGRLKKYKSVHHIIKAVKLLKKDIFNIRLIIVGDGDYRKELEKLVGNLNLKENVEFTGYVPHDKKIEILRKSHLSVYPSLIEGWGLVNIESAACGTPVVASRVPGLKDSVKEGYSGYLYEYGNIEDMADKISKIIKKINTEDYKKMQKNCVEWANEFDWDKSANRMESLLKEVLHRRFYGNAYTS